MKMDPQDCDPVKEVEVTAKQIVDRITNNRSSLNSDKAEKGKVGVKRVSLSSSYGDPPEEKSNGGPAADGDKVLNQSPGRSERISVSELIEPTEHEKKAEILLTAVSKWLNEASPDGSKNPVGHLDIQESFHWIYSIESYIRTLNWSSQKVLTGKFMTSVVKWHKQLFHFSKEKVKDDVAEYNRVLPHWDVNAGVVSIAKLNLFTIFPNYLSKGYDAFSEQGKTPLIYCSDETVGHMVASKLGLPRSFVTALNTNDEEWVDLFEKSILDHEKNDVVPLMLIIGADAKSLHRGCRLAEAYNIWVHLYGVNLLPYLILRMEHNQIGSSCTIDYSKWIQNPALPYLTFYKSSGKTEPSLLELVDLAPSKSDASVFSPWFILNVLGHDEIRTAVSDVVSRGKFLFQLIRKYKCLHLVPIWSELSDGSVVTTNLSFQYHPTTAPKQEQEQVEEVTPSTRYVDTLNSWLYNIIDRDLKEFVPVEYLHAPSGDWNIHIDVTRCPKWEPEDESVILSLFDNHLSVLQSTVAQKLIFSRLVQETEELEWIDHEIQWAGLGAVRYIPTFHRKKLASNGDDSGNSSEDPSVTGVKENIDHLNAQIVEKLKAFDSAFSLGESSNGEWCVQFGMVTMETDVKQLVRLVISSGQEIEESSEFLNRMSELVKKGIEKATEELRRESEEALWEEGILRRVPIVGTFVSWFSPPSKETGVRGRALNLTQGKVESTENIYKYHMQVEGPPPSHSASNN